MSAKGHFKNIHRRYLLGGMVDFEKNEAGHPITHASYWRLHCILPSKRTYAGEKTIQISYTRWSCTLPTNSLCKKDNNFKLKRLQFQSFLKGKKCFFDSEKVQDLAAMISAFQS